MKRRSFLQSSLAAAGALSTPAAIAKEKESPAPRVRRYRPLGRTGFKMSDISFGGGHLSDPNMVGRALQLGINYFDTAPDYGDSEKTLGRVLAKYHKRNDIFIATKFCDPVPYKSGKSHLQLPQTSADYVAAVEGSLKRLRTDHVDVIFVHAMGELADGERERKRLLDSNMLEAFAALKKAGKARFLAVSSHGPHGMESLLGEAVESGHYDIIMPAFNFINFPKLPSVISRAHAKGMGIVAMKTLAGAREMKPPPPGPVFEHAAFKWVLGHPEVGGLIVTMKSLEQMGHFVGASGLAFEAADQSVLERYALQFGGDYCRTGCGRCEASCPSQVSIASVLRYQMYFESYGAQQRATELYARLPRNVDACLTCQSQACNAACPHGLSVSAKLSVARRQLTMA